jgi:SAM-dependent methyltransferase
VAPAERLDFLESGTVDVVLCTQVLEHALDPREVVGEMRRVLRPAGIALLSTHGVFPYHGQPRDYWRWTHEGLERLFHESGFGAVSVEATDGIASAILGAADFYAWTLADRYRAWRFLRYTLHPLLGLVAPRLDRYLGWTFADHPMAINYLVAARPVAPA